jgi:TRAP transporter TAXI family solute receptor
MLGLIAVGFGGAAALGYAGWRFLREKPPAAIRIATGSKGGTYLPLGTAIADVLNERLPGVRASVLETAGSLDNIRRLEAREVEAALVQNDTPGGSGVRSIAPLYEEVLHIIVPREGPIQGIEDLRGKRVSIGPAGSGTEGIARIVFAHFGLSDVDERHLALSAAAAAFERSEIDAIFALTGLRAPAIAGLLARTGARLLSLGDPERLGSPIEALRIDAPYLLSAVIPQATYGRTPPAPVGTLGVQALFVVREDLPENLVHAITQAIFEEKVRLAEREKVVARLSEHFDPGEIRFPLHSGAVRYYKREGPAFIQQWAETISLGITVLVLLGSGIFTMREALRRWKKNRIDVYYLEIRDIGNRIRAARSVEELLALKEKLGSLRLQAFEELVAERLEANESFTIFQDYLRSQLLELESQIAAARAAALSARFDEAHARTEAQK